MRTGSVRLATLCFVGGEEPYGREHRLAGSALGGDWGDYPGYSQTLGVGLKKKVAAGYSLDSWQAGSRKIKGRKGGETYKPIPLARAAVAMACITFIKRSRFVLVSIWIC